MMHVRERLAVASLFFVCATSAMAADTNPSSDVKDGPALRRDAAPTNVPVDKRYDQMDAEQRARIKAHYEAMGPADEPPFPADGMAWTMMALREGAAARHVSGDLDMAVDVGPDGAARSVSIYAAPDDAEFRKYVASLLMMTRYKPAVCGGRPCAMAWPLQVTFSRH